ncbi:MAG TPA: S41 family peptidase [Solirubrobacterales bacterium]|nr:S41 family peptidase [Solirubrobacterales bacterium]
MRVAFLALFAVVIGMVTGLWIGGHPENLPTAVSDIFIESPAGPGVSPSDEAAEVIGRKYFRETDPDQVQDASIRGMVSKLRKQYKDRFSHYFDPKQLADFTDSIEGSFSGVGMTVGEAGKNGLRVGYVFKNSPADDAGIETGDVIVTVDGESIKGESADLTVAKIKGPEGTDVVLGIKKRGKGKTEELTLTREEIRVPITSNRVKDVDGQKLGYVRLTTFSNGASRALRRAVDKVREKGAEGLVLDLRANGGGLLPEAVLTSSIFVPKDEIVVETKSRTEKDETYRAVGGDIGDFPVTVLVNRDTASAAEILAAALQTNIDAPVVGTRTFGKGVFQQVINLDSGGALDLTVGEFFTADGVSLAGKGLKPDVVARLAPDAERDTQLDRAYEVLSGEIAASGDGS